MPVGKVFFRSNSSRTTFDQSKTNLFDSGKNKHNVSRQFHSKMSFSSNQIRNFDRHNSHGNSHKEFVKFYPKNEDCKFFSYCAHFRDFKIPCRLKHVKKHHLCFNCLGTHMFKDCSSDKLCPECSGKHTFLQEENGTRVKNKISLSKTVQITNATNCTWIDFARPNSRNIRLPW